MSWRDRLQQARFRGIDIYVDYSAWNRGRRVPVRELVGQDTSVQQDLGRSPDTIEITAFFWGQKFDLDRNALEDALLTEGATTLTLPTRGDLNVRVISGPFTNEERLAQGYCTIRFTVVVEPRKAGSTEARASAGLIGGTDTAAKLTTSAQAVQATAEKSTLANLIARGMPSQTLKSTIRAVQDATSTLRGIQGSIQAQLNVINDLSASLADLNSTANIILGTPATLASKITAVVTGVFAIADTAQNNIDRTTGLALGSAATPFEKASPARATLAAVKTMALLGATATTSNGTSMGTGTVLPDTVSRVGAGGPAASATPSVAAGAGSSSSSSSGSGSSGSGSSGSTGGATSGSSSTAAIAAALGQARTTLSIADQEQVNTRAVYQQVRGLSIGRAAETFATAAFDSSTLALAALETMSDVIDDLQAYSGSDDLFDALADLRGALASHLTAVASELPSAAIIDAADSIQFSVSGAGTVRIVVGQTADSLDTSSKKSAATNSGAGLPRVVEYDPPREVPAILIAYELYGNAELEADIVARNNTPYPLFVAGSIELIEP
jgi:prophage DNA circulation protein